MENLPYAVFLCPYTFYTMITLVQLKFTDHFQRKDTRVDSLK